MNIGGEKRKHHKQSARNDHRETCEKDMHL